MVRYWGVRLGEGGKYVNDGRKGNYVAIGWDDLGNLNWLATAKESEDLFEKLKKQYAKVYGGESELSPVKIGLESGEVLRFVREINKGDIILVPDPPDRKVLMGRVTGTYE